MNTIPAITRENTDAALRALAVIKSVRSELKKREDVVKAYLHEAMRPGDRSEAFTTDGKSIATISMDKGKKCGGLVVVDPIALADWCDENGVDHGGKPSVVFPEWFTAKNNLEAIVARNGGELPDGVEDFTHYSAPTVSVRQKPAQKDAFFAAVVNVRTLLAAAEIEVAE